MALTVASRHYVPKAPVRLHKPPPALLTANYSLLTFFFRERVKWYALCAFYKFSPMCYNKSIIDVTWEGVLEFLSHVFGQTKLKTRLSQLLREERLPHTMIFCGDEGLGKTTAALSLAETLTGSSVWDEWPAWQSAETEKDLLLVNRAGRIFYIRPIGASQTLRIEQFRAFLEAMATFDDAVRVCIIDEAQGMRREIANALLKTLEEPPKNLYFILITHEIEALLPTIRSRGAAFPFFALSEEEFTALARVKGDVFPFQSEADIHTAYLLSEGNPGMAAEMFAETGVRQPETAMDVWEILTSSATPFSEAAAFVPKERSELRRMLRWMALIGRDLFVLSSAPGGDFARCRQILGREEAVLPSWGGRRAEAAVRILKEAEIACKLNISVKNIWDMVTISLLRSR